MDKKNWIKLIRLDIVYFILVAIFSYKLVKLNVILIEEQKVKTALELLYYNNYIVLKYFGGALTLIITAIVLIISKWQKYVSGFYLEETVFLEFILVIALCFVIGWLIYLVNNPILKIILKSLVFTIGIIEFSNK